MSLAELPLYEETLTSLAAYLIVARQKHPDALLKNSAEKVNPSRLRLLRRYALALLTCGVPSNTDELQDVINLFCTPFPLANGRNLVDTTEMLRLEGLLHLKPEDEGVSARLRQLIEQRQSDLTYSIPPVQELPVPRLSIGNTLWAVQVLEAARDRRILNGSISSHDLKATLDVICPLMVRGSKLNRRDRDVALALRLYYDINGRLEAYHERILKALVEKAQNSGSLWGVTKPNQVEDLITAIHLRRLPPRYATYRSEDPDDPTHPSVQSGTDVNGMEEELRDIVVATCQIVENLAPLAQEYDFVRSAIEQGMDLWWGQIAGSDAPIVLHTIFPNEHDFLTVSCLTITAASAYTGETLKERSWMSNLRHRAEKFVGVSDNESIGEAFRHWLDIQVAESTPLELGLSGSTVARFTPVISTPTSGKLSWDLSLIVKYGRTEEINNERENYKQIPKAIREHFVRIPDKRYDSPQGETFVIMEDLINYSTLYEKYVWLLEFTPEMLGRHLANFLKTIHKGGGGPSKPSTNKHLRDLYILPMLNESEQILSMAEYIRRKGKPDRLRTEHFDEINDILQRLITRINPLGPFPLAFMHGDLHTRNIMIFTPSGARKPTYKFKLIDLEKVRVEGDMAHDAGQLLVDLEVLPLSNSTSGQNPTHVKLVRLHDFLEKAYHKFAIERGDTSFAIRLELAKSRALLRITKGRFKRAQRHLDNRELNEADQFVIETLGLIGSTREMLTRVYDHISAEH